MFDALMVLAVFVAGMALGMAWSTRSTKPRIAQAYENGKAELAPELASVRARLEERAQRLAELESALAEREAENQQLAEELGVQRETVSRLEAEARAALSQQQNTQRMLEGAQTELEAARKEINRLGSALAETQATLATERSETDKKLALLTQARDELTHQFKALAAEILDEKARAFGEKSTQSLSALLNPLSEKIREFQTKVEEVYVTESKERHTLQAEVKRLAELNAQISADAVNLTRALKGDSKTQGIWGERVLESVLESSGLRKGEEYEVQASLGDEEGGRSRPDVIVHLPEGKHVVIDSKVSLTAYERYVSAESDEEREHAAKAHVASLRAHVKGLSEKNYHSLYGLKSLDFVLMFIPVEPAFMLGVTKDHSLFDEAFRKNVLLVSPSTLLATLRTIASIWRQEYQSRNAQAIARHCASLYDKFVGFAADLETVGKRLEATRAAYDDARAKLATGRGNLVSQVERIRKLGVKPAKSLPADLVELAVEADGDMPTLPMSDEEDA